MMREVEVEEGGGGGGGEREGEKGRGGMVWRVRCVGGSSDCGRVGGGVIDARHEYQRNGAHDQKHGIQMAAMWESVLVNA